MAVLEDIKTLLSLDSSHDSILTICQTEAEARVLARISNDTIPIELEHVVRYVSIAIYNRLGAEGIRMESDTLGTVTYIDVEDVLDEFEPDLKRYAKSTKRLVVI